MTNNKDTLKYEAKTSTTVSFKFHAKFSVAYSRERYALFLEPKWITNQPQSLSHKALNNPRFRITNRLKQVWRSHPLGTIYLNKIINVIERAVLMIARFIKILWIHILNPYGLRNMRITDPLYLKYIPPHILRWEIGCLVQQIYTSFFFNGRSRILHNFIMFGDRLRLFKPSITDPPKQLISNMFFKELRQPGSRFFCVNSKLVILIIGLENVH